MPRTRSKASHTSASESEDDSFRMSRGSDTEEGSFSSSTSSSSSLSVPVTRSRMDTRNRREVKTRGRKKEVEEEREEQEEMRTTRSTRSRSRAAMSSSTDTLDVEAASVSRGTGRSRRQAALRAMEQISNLSVKHHDLTSSVLDSSCATSVEDTSEMDETLEEDSSSYSSEITFDEDERNGDNDDQEESYVNEGDESIDNDESSFADCSYEPISSSQTIRSLRSRSQKLPVSSRFREQKIEDSDSSLVESTTSEVSDLEISIQDTKASRPKRTRARNAVSTHMEVDGDTTDRSSAKPDVPMKRSLRSRTKKTEEDPSDLDHVGVVAESKKRTSRSTRSQASTVLSNPETQTNEKAKPTLTRGRPRRKVLEDSVLSVDESFSHQASIQDPIQESREGLVVETEQEEKANILPSSSSTLQEPNARSRRRRKVLDDTSILDASSDKIEQTEMEESEAVPAKRAKKDSKIISAVPRSRKQSRSAIDLEQQGSIEDVVTSKAFNRESPVISNQKSEPAEYIPMLCDQSSLNDLSSIYNSSLADSMMQQSPKPCAQVPQVEIPQSISSLDQNSDMDGTTKSCSLSDSSGYKSPLLCRLSEEKSPSSSEDDDDGNDDDAAHGELRNGDDSRRITSEATGNTNEKEMLDRPLSYVSKQECEIDIDVGSRISDGNSTQLSSALPVSAPLLVESPFTARHHPLVQTLLHREEFGDELLEDDFLPPIPVGAFSEDEQEDESACDKMDNSKVSSASRDAFELDCVALVRDIRIQAESKISNLRQKLEVAKFELRSRAQTELSKLPQSIRQMPARDLFSKFGGSFVCASNSEKENARKDIVHFFESIKTPMRSAAPATPGKGQKTPKTPGRNNPRTPLGSRTPKSALPITSQLPLNGNVVPIRNTEKDPMRPGFLVHSDTFETPFSKTSIPLSIRPPHSARKVILSRENEKDLLAIELENGKSVLDAADPEAIKRLSGETRNEAISSLAALQSQLTSLLAQLGVS